MAAHTSLSKRLDVRALNAPKRPFCSLRHCDPCFNKQEFLPPPPLPLAARASSRSRSQEPRAASQSPQQPFRPSGIGAGFGAPKMVSRNPSSARSPSASVPHTPRCAAPPIPADDFAIRIAQHVSRRPNEIAQQIEEAKAAKVKRMLDMRYNMVVDDEALDGHTNGLMKRVSKSGLRVEYYARNRKRTMSDLLTRRSIAGERVRAVRDRHLEDVPVCGPLSTANIEYIVECAGDDEYALHRLGMISMQFSEVVQAKLVERNTQVNAAVRARLSLAQGRRDLERIPRSYFKAIQAVKGELPARVAFVLALVVLLLEKSARLSANPVARNSDTAEVFRSYLAVGGIEDTVGLMTALDPHSLPQDTTAAATLAVAKGMRELGVQTETQLLLAMRSYNEHTEALLKWVLAVLAYQRELSPVV